MKRILTTLAATAAFVGAAIAGEREGIVRSVDTDARIVTLEDGATYRALEGIDLEGIDVGTKVRVTFEDGTTNAILVEPLA